MEFFNGQRRHTQLKSWLPKHNQENEKRILLNFTMPLTGQKIIGFPDFINDSFMAIEKTSAPIEEIILDTEIEGITLEIFDTDEAKRRTQMIPAVTLRKFALERKGDETFLTFNTTIQRSKDILMWAHDYEGADIFIQFDATQAKLVFAEDEANNQEKLFNGTEETEEVDEEEEEVAKVSKNWKAPGKAAKGKK